MSKGKLKTRKVKVVRHMRLQPTEIESEKEQSESENQKSESGGTHEASTY